MKKSASEWAIVLWAVLLTLAYLILVFSPISMLLVKLSVLETAEEFLMGFVYRDYIY